MTPDRPASRALPTFVLLAFAFSWAVAWPLAASALGWIPWRLAPALHLLIGFGPALAALVVAARAGPGARAFLRAALAWPGLRWAALAFLAPVALHVGAVLLAALLRGAGFSPAGMPPASGVPPFAFVVMAPLYVLTFGLGEELGWRGFALPRLEARFSPRAATLVLAAVWAAWHLPLVVDPAAIGKGGAAGVMRWAMGMLAGAFVMTWLYHRTGSALACALFHGSLNAAASVVADPLAEALVTGLIGLWGVLVASWGAPFAGTRAGAASPGAREDARPPLEARGP